jgi:hypothetical protein
MSNLPQVLGVNEVAIHEASILRRFIHARLEREVSRAIDTEHAHGIVLAARIGVVKYVAAGALKDIADLTEQEEHYAERAPDKERRLGRIVEIASTVMGDLVAEAGGE